MSMRKDQMTRKAERKVRAQLSRRGKQRTERRNAPNLLRESRVYLSGPMDFVASRANEKKFGWRNRVSEFLRGFGVTVFDPWNKPDVRGFHEYGCEDDKSSAEREKWKWESGKTGAEARAYCAEKFWPSLHIDLRMVDTSDFLIAYCPTNIYSVGTPHEIILARQERKPVLFVSPRVQFPKLDELKVHLESRNDRIGSELLERLEEEVPIKPNPNGVPSLWYMPLIGGEHFFDGFGFSAYRNRLRWQAIPMDEQEERRPPERPLLPFLELLSKRLPKKWSPVSGRWITNDDWLLWNLKRLRGKGAQVDSAY
jgi:hypothetical protein